MIWLSTIGDFWTWAFSLIFYDLSDKVRRRRGRRLETSRFESGRGQCPEKMSHSNFLRTLKQRLDLVGSVTSDLNWSIIDLGQEKIALKLKSWNFLFILQIQRNCTLLEFVSRYLGKLPVERFFSDVYWNFLLIIRYLQFQDFFTCKFPE